MLFRSEGRAERMAVLRKGLAPDSEAPQKRTAMFRKGQHIGDILSREGLSPTSDAYQDRLLELRWRTFPELVELLDKLKAQEWVEKEMEDIQTELESPIPDGVFRALISSQSHPEADEELRIYLLKHRAHEKDEF